MKLSKLHAALSALVVAGVIAFASMSFSGEPISDADLKAAEITNLEMSANEESSTDETSYADTEVTEERGILQSIQDKFNAILDEYRMSTEKVASDVSVEEPPVAVPAIE